MTDVRAAFGQRSTWLADGMRKRPLARRRLVSAVAILGFSVPLAAYLWFIHHYSINVVFADQWDDVNVIGHSYSGGLTLSTLWAQHNESRILIPNLIVLLLAHTAQFNVLLEEYLSALVLCGTTGLLIWAHKRRSPSQPWIAYCPVAILMLSLVQSGNTLWGFQLAWYLVLAMLALTLFLLDRALLTRLAFAAAIGAAVVGSLSLIQGLFIWPAGLILLYHRRRSLSQVIVWCGAAAATVVVYFQNFNFHAALPSYLSGLHLPGPAIRFFFQAIGDVLGVKLNDAGGALNNAVLALGVALFLVSIYAVITRGLRRDNSTGGPFGVALICFGLLFAASIAYGRAWAGPSAASASRYTTFDLLVLVGIYFAVLPRSPRATPSRLPVRLATSGVGIVLVGAICLQVVVGLASGIRDGRSIHQSWVRAAVVLVDINEAPDSLVQAALYPDVSATFVRREAKILKRYRLSLFATDAVGAYARIGLSYEKEGFFKAPKASPVTTVLVPRYGAILRGRTLLDASGGDSVRVLRVEFQLTGGSLHDARIGLGTPTLDGWILHWNTRSTPNGTYMLESVVYGAGGNVSRSSAVAITVQN